MRKSPKKRVFGKIKIQFKKHLSKKKFSKRFKIISYPYRIEDISKFKKWLKFRKFDYFIHFASITRNEEKKYKSKIKIINFDSTQKIIETLNEKVIKHFKFFLFISSSHVYGHSPKKIKENNKRNPINELSLIHI